MIKIKRWWRKGWAYHRSRSLCRPTFLQESQYYLHQPGLELIEAKQRAKWLFVFSWSNPGEVLVKSSHNFRSPHWQLWSPHSPHCLLLLFWCHLMSLCVVIINININHHCWCLEPNWWRRLVWGLATVQNVLPCTHREETTSLPALRHPESSPASHKGFLIIKLLKMHLLPFHFWEA